MNIKLNYNNSEIEVNVKKKNILDILSPKKVKVSDEKGTLRRSLSTPLHDPPLERFLLNTKRLLVILNDATKPTPTAKILDFLSGYLTGNKVKFLIATGAHKPPTKSDLKLIFGKNYSRFSKHIFIHDAYRDEEMVYLGTTSRETGVYINRLATEADKLLVIGSVEPHYFAGYTGGRKAIIPGIASYKTIEANHRFALSPEAISLKLEGNPVDEDIMEGLRFFEKEIFSIQVVLNHDRKIYSAEAGNIIDSHLLALEKANEVFVVNAKAKADIVVTIAKSPWDINFYQSQQAIENGKRILKDGGILILVSACKRGVGEGYYSKILSSCKTAKEVIEKIDKKPYKLGAHKAKRIAELVSQVSFRAVTKLPDRELEKIFVKPYHNVQKAIDDALIQKGKNAKISFLLDGATTVPVVNSTYDSTCEME